MFRPYRNEDLEAVTALLRADEERSTGRPSRIGTDDLRAWLAGVTLATDTWLAEEDGRPAAFGWHELNADVAFSVGVVDPAHRGRGLGTALVRRAIDRAREAGAARLHYAALADDADAPRLFEAHGLREVRRFYDMAIELEGPPPSPSLPDGLVLDRFRGPEEAQAFHHALDEAFQDHWEHHGRSWEEWWERQTSMPDHDPTLWFVVRDAGEIAATARNDPHRNGGGWVGALGVRRAWRGRGLAKALLLHTFGEFHRRGVNRVSLGVDAENPSGATHLYERVGMVKELEQVVYERALA